MEKQPSRYLLTLPYGALPLNAPRITQGTNDVAPLKGIYEPNARLFDLRHTVTLSTPSFTGEIPYILIKGRAGASMPQFDGNDDILTERGIYGIGEEVVMVKPSTRTLSLAISITAEGDYGMDMDEVMTHVAYWFSWEHCTSIDPTAATHLMSPTEYPSPFTITQQTVDIEGNIINRHIDFYAAHLDNDTMNAESHLCLNTNLIIPVHDPRWYGDELSSFVNGLSEDPDFAALTPPINGDVGILDPSTLPVSKFDTTLPTGSFRYRGSARTGFRVEVVLTSVTNDPIEFFSWALVDTTVPGALRWRRIRYNLFSGGTGLVLQNSPATIVIDTEQRLFYEDLGGGTFDYIHPYLDASITRDWGAFTFIPGRVYTMGFEAQDANNVNVTAFGTMVFRTRWGGI